MARAAGVDLSKFSTADGTLTDKMFHDALYAGPNGDLSTLVSWKSEVLQDPWTSLYFVTLNADGSIRVVSNGPNKIYENGRGDDVVFNCDSEGKVQ